MDETVTCFCNTCSEELGQFRNAWNVIGNNYYTPVYPILTYNDGFAGRGDVRASKLGSYDTCFLQDLVCKACRVYLGIRCDSAPKNHILQKNQFLLRLSEITTLVAGTNQKAKILVKNSFILEAADGSAAKRSKSKAASVGPSRSKSMSVQPSSHSNDAMMPPPPTPIVKPSGNPPVPFTVPSAFNIWAEKELKDQRKDIDRISTAVTRIEKTMDEIKDFMGEVRAQSAADQEREKTLRFEAAKAMKTDMSNLQKMIVASEKKSSDAIGSLTLSFNSQFNAKWGSLVRRMENIDKTGVDSANVLKQELKEMYERLLKLEAAAPSTRVAASEEQHALGVDDSALRQRPSDPSRRAEAISMQSALEMAAHDEESALSYEMPHQKDLSRSRNRLPKSKTSQPSQATQNLPISRALELDGMVDKTGYASAGPRYSTDLFKTKDNSIPVQKTTGMGKTRVEANPRTKESKTSKRVESTQQPSMAEPPTWLENFTGQKSFKNPTEVNVSKQDVATMPPRNSILRVEISPMKPDLGFPAILLSPDSSNSSDVESIPAVSPIAKRKRAEPLDNSRQVGEKELSQSNTNPPKRRRVSDQAFRDGAVTSQTPHLETNGQHLAPEPGAIGFKDNIPQTSSNGGVSKSATNKARKEPPSEPASDAGHDSEELLSMLNDIARRPFRPSSRPKAHPSSVQSRGIGSSSHAPISIEDGYPLEHLATPEQIQKPFKCGVCQRRYARIQSLKMHKNSSSACKADSSRDEMPSNFVCNGCEQSFSSLLYFNRHKCPSFSTNTVPDIPAANKKSTAIKRDDEDLRRKTLAAREQLVKETLEMEMLRAQKEIESEILRRKDG